MVSGCNIALDRRCPVSSKPWFFSLHAFCSELVERGDPRKLLRFDRFLVEEIFIPRLKPFRSGGKFRNFERLHLNAPCVICIFLFAKEVARILFYIDANEYFYIYISSYVHTNISRERKELVEWASWKDFAFFIRFIRSKNTPRIFMHASVIEIKAWKNPRTVSGREK